MLLERAALDAGSRGKLVDAAVSGGIRPEQFQRPFYIARKRLHCCMSSTRSAMTLARENSAYPLIRTLDGGCGRKMDSLAGPARRCWAVASASHQVELAGESPG